jgi:4-amino-4-deoxy-L-arabinose transferase-like glycosyltransferase
MVGNRAPHNREVPWQTLFGLGLITLAGFALGVHDLGTKSFWYDELRQVQVAQLPFAEWTEALKLHAARPLDYLLTRLLLNFTRSEWVLRLPALLWSTLTIPVVYQLGRRLLGRREGLIAAFLFSQSALIVTYAQEMRPYALYALAAAVSFWALDAGLRGGSWRAWAVYAAAHAVGVLAHYFWLMILAGQIVYVAASALLGGVARRRVGQFALAAAAGVAVLFLTADASVVVPLAENFAGAVAAQAANTAPTVSLHAPGVNPFAPTMTSDFFVGRILEQLGAGGGLALWLFNGLAVLGVAASVQARVRHGALLARFAGRLPYLLAWLFVGPGLIIGYLVYRNEIFAMRYVLFALPAYLLLTARGLTAVLGWLKEQRGALAAGGLAVAALAVFTGLNARAVWAYYATPKDDWRRMGAFLAANVRPGDAIFAPDVQTFVEYYFPGASEYLVYADSRREAQYTYAQHTRTWFVVSNWATYDTGDTRKVIELFPGVTYEWATSAYIKFTQRGLADQELETEAASFAIPPPSLPGGEQP